MAEGGALDTAERHRQLPNPTIIDSIRYQDIVKAGGKTIVFTAYLYEKQEDDVIPEEPNSIVGGLDEEKGAG